MPLLYTGLQNRNIRIMENDQEILETEDSEEYEEGTDNSEFRRKRVKRIKGILIFLLIFFLIVPNIVCGFLLFKLYKMNQNIETLREEIKLSKLEIEMRTKQAASAKPEANEDSSNDDEKYGTDSLVELHLTDEEKYPGKQLVYLTFDDGPSDYTDEILDILSAHDVKATFFVLGKDGYDDQYRRIANEGHTLAMHSYSHQYKEIYASADAFREDLYKISNFLEERTGIKPKFYRFPGGSSNTLTPIPIQEFIHVLSDEGIVYQDWNVSSEDASYQMKETGVIAKNVINGVGDNRISIVLMHDSVAKRTTVEALPIIIETLQQKGNVVFLPITEGTKQVYQIGAGATDDKKEDAEVKEPEKETETNDASETVSDEDESVSEESISDEEKTSGDDISSTEENNAGEENESED